jgi:hypothetical protein
VPLGWYPITESQSSVIPGLDPGSPFRLRNGMLIGKGVDALLGIHINRKGERDNLVYE